jgi:NTP pyrophosphatase (non-canonical NTP hydrolase)
MVMMKKEIYERVIMDFLEEGTTEETLFVGLASEIGEVMSERVRETRKGENRTEQIKDELADVLVYITFIHKQRNLSLGELMLHAYNKLESRAINGKK